MRGAFLSIHGDFTAMRPWTQSKVDSQVFSFISKEICIVYSVFEGVYNFYICGWNAKLLSPITETKATKYGLQVGRTLQFYHDIFKVLIVFEPLCGWIPKLHYLKGSLTELAFQVVQSWRPILWMKS